MKFAALLAIVADDLEERAIDSAKRAGGGGVTIIDAKGIGAEEKKTFFGLTYEGSQSVLLFILEKKLSVRVLKQLDRDLDLANTSKGVAFTLPLEHVAGIDPAQIRRFEERIRDDI